MKKKTKRRKSKKVRKTRKLVSAIPDVLQSLFAAIETKLQEYTSRRLQLVTQVGQLDQGIEALLSLKKLPHATLATMQTLGTAAPSPATGRRNASRVLQHIAPLGLPLMGGVPVSNTLQGALLSLVQASPNLRGPQILELARTTGNPALRGITQQRVSSSLNALSKKGSVTCSGHGRYGTWSTS